MSEEWNDEREIREYNRWPTGMLYATQNHDEYTLAMPLEVMLDDGRTFSATIGEIMDMQRIITEAFALLQSGIATVESVKPYIAVPPFSSATTQEAMNIAVFDWAQAARQFVNKESNK